MTSEQEEATDLLEQTAEPSENVNTGEDHEEKEPPSHSIGDEDDDEPLIGSSSEDPEKTRNYQEYKRIVKEINFQNNTIENFKTRITELREKKCLNSSERKELRSLYDCLEQEMEKLRCLTNKAMNLQNFGSRRHYKEINLMTTFDEDQMNPTAVVCENIQMNSSNAAAYKRQPDICYGDSDGDIPSEMEKSCSYKNVANQWEPDEQELMKEINAALLKCSSNKKSNKKKTMPYTKNDSMCKLKQRICGMQNSINKINKAISKHKNSHEPKETFLQETSKPSISVSCSPFPMRGQEFQKLKDKYMYLLTEFSKKEDELKKINERLKNSCGSTGGTGTADASEIHLLTNRINELKEEQIEFKCLMREQSSQLEDYRNKYLTAQQKVEEQCALIQKLNMNNKRVEKQINLEVKEIRCKFQEKLNELVKFPKLLENEQIKVAKLCKDKEDLESKLIIVCKELKTQKNMSDQQGDGVGENYKSQLQKSQQELQHTKKSLEEIQRERDIYCEKLKVTQDDLDCLRSESAKIIARLKERSDLIKQQQQEHIDRLEKQLAQCRATACLSVSDRECVIREMQGQLNTLSYSFDTAQKQIKTLRNHIAYMSNEHCFPSKC